MDNWLYNRVWQQLFDRAVLFGRTEHEKVLYGSAAEMMSQHKLVCDLLSRNIKREGALVADVGCGVGSYAPAIKKMGFIPIGCDYSMNMLNQARFNYEERLTQSTADILPYRSCGFTAVLAIGVLQTVLDHRGALTEISRILKPGGFLILSTLGVPSIWELPLFPVMQILMSDRSLKDGMWYLRLIKDRSFLSWHSRPSKYKAKRYGVKEIYCCLKEIGFHRIRHYYSGRIKKIPLLFNTQIVTYCALKNG